MEWQTVGGVGLGREGLHERRTRTPHRKHSQAGRGRPGAGRVVPRLPSPQAPLLLPAGEGGGLDLGAAAPPPDCAPVGARGPAISGGWRRDFCRSCPLGSGWQVGRERAEGSFWRLPKKKGQKKNLSPPEAGNQASKHTVQNANPQATHPHTHPHTHTQFYLPLVAKIKLPSDTRSALRVSVQFNDD